MKALPGLASWLKYVVKVFEWTSYRCGVIIPLPNCGRSRTVKWSNSYIFIMDA
jgi:hypothetical protein